MTDSTRFDVREYARTARGSLRDALDLGGYGEHPLSADSLRLLRYLGQLEGATMQHLRNVLVTATHKDARVTAFLVSWAFEKFWIADAVAAILEANNAPQTPPIAVRRGGEWAEHRGPIGRAISAMVAGTPIVAVHMTLGLVDEWVTRAGYERLAEGAGSAALSATVRDILEIKARQSLFFAEEARRRLEESEKAARLTRRALGRAALPIGAVDRDTEDRDFFAGYVFGGAEGSVRADAIEEAITALPGIGSGTAARLRSGLVR